MAIGWRSAAALIVAPVLLAASSAERPLRANEKAAITHSIEAKLVDPASAQFRLGPTRPGSEYYCGLVNAKNRMGGYNGFEPFLVRYNPDRTIKIATLPSAASIGPSGRFDATIHQRLWLPLVSATCAKEGYSTAY